MKNNVKVQDDTQSLQSYVSVSVTDLRIGNLVSIDINALHYQIDCEQIFEIEEIKKETTHFKGFFSGEYFKDLKPIAITEELLLTIGLSKQNGYPYKFLDGYLKLRNGIYFYKYYNLEIELPFVHNLQNLHYALKGCELQIGNLTEH